MLRCSFCHRPDVEVAKLAAGPVRLLSRRVYICDRCAVEAHRVMDSHQSGPRTHDQPASLLTRTIARLPLWRHKKLVAVSGW
jgi:hypothetical protein